MKTKHFRLAVLTMASMLISACVVTPDPYYDQPVRVAPPPLRHEYPGYPPATDYIWMSGYWGWGGARYEWIPGRWEAPRHGHIWVPHRWERNGDHWRQSGGRWEQDARQRPVPAPRMEQRRDDPPRREWGGDSRDVQQRSEPRPVPRVEPDSRSRYEHRENGRPADVNPAFRTERGNAPRPESRPPQQAAPATVPAPQPSQMKREDRSRGEHKDDSRSRRRQPGDER